MINLSAHRTEPILVIFPYLMLMAGVLICLDFIWFQNLLTPENLVNWDTHHYQFIAKNGYQDYRVAFFPLFPLLWKWSMLNPLGISCLNGFVFLIFFYLMMKQLKASLLETCIYLSIPSFIFFYLPYTESLFFASSCLILYGLKTQRTSWVLTGIFFSTLTRPVFIILLPALVLTELITVKKYREVLVRTGLYLAITVFAILIVAWIQYQDTGRWFEFISIQENWGNRLQFPNLPLTSWAGGFIIRLDGLALFVAASAGITLLLYLLKKRGLPGTPLPREVVLSFGYLGGMAALSLLIKGGTLASLNRYVFAVPFVIVAFNFYLRSEIKTTIKQTLVFFLIIFFYWFLFRSFVHIVTLLLYTSVTFYACLFMLMKSGSTSLSRWSTFLLIGINLVFQVIFMVRFLNGIWVG